MSNFDIISMSLRNLFKRKLRTFLTILGVVIGTAAIIVMVSLGIAVNKNYEESISSMGDVRTLTIRNPGGGGGAMYMGGGMMVSESGGQARNGKVELNEKAVNEFKEMPHVIAVTPVTEIYINAMSGKYISNLNIKGIDVTTMEDFDYKLEEGEFLHGADNYGVIFGHDAVNNFYNPNDRNWWRNQSDEPVVNIFEDKIEMSYEWGYGYQDDSPFQDTESDDKKPKPKPIKIQVKGKLAPMNWDTDYYVFMDIKEVQKLKLDKARYEQSQNQGGGYSGGQGNRNLNEYDSVMIKVDDIKNVEAIKNLVEKKGYYADSYFIDMLNEMNEMSKQLQFFLGAIGAVSLFVAAIGIANTMIMSIYERTKEIGVMKVIGASLNDIKKLFLFESAFIGFVGGVIGLVLSYLISYLLNNAQSGLSIFGGMGGMYMGDGGMSKVSVIPPWLALSALAFSALIGLISGYFPAHRAMNLSALDAIRSE